MIHTSFPLPSMGNLRRCMALGSIFGSFLAADVWADDTPMVLKSPDGGIVAAVQTGDHLTYTVQFQGKPVLDASAMGVTINGEDLGQEAVLNGTPETIEINEQYPTRGGHSTATNHCLATTIPLKGGQSQREWLLEVRVFDDAVAYRYRIPTSGKEIHIDGESSSWSVPADSTIWSQDAKNRSYESFFHSSEVDQMAANVQVLAPATLQFANGLGYGMITEANLFDYCDMDLEKTGPATFRALFYDSPHGWTQQRRRLGHTLAGADPGARPQRAREHRCHQEPLSAAPGGTGERGVDTARPVDLALAHGRRAQARSAARLDRRSGGDGLRILPN